jgi:hypothetical protein
MLFSCTPVSTLVDYSTHNPMIEGSNPVEITGACTVKLFTAVILAIWQ